MALRQSWKYNCHRYMKAIYAPNLSFSHSHSQSLSPPTRKPKRVIVLVWYTCWCHHCEHEIILLWVPKRGFRGSVFSHWASFDQTLHTGSEIIQQPCCFASSWKRRVTKNYANHKWLKGILWVRFSVILQKTGCSYIYCEIIYRCVMWHGDLVCDLVVLKSCKVGS